ncbi:MAG: 7TM diverse intracellular signaling domain-containing protein [Cytophagaceae bacterium]
MKIKNIPLIVFFIFVSILQTSAQKVVELNDSITDFMFHGPYLHIYEDKTKKIEIDEVATPGFQSRFSANQNYYAFNENEKSAYWIRAIISKAPYTQKRFVFESYSLHSEVVLLYMPDGKGGYIEKRAGQKFDFFQREYVHKNLAFDLPIKPGTQDTIYIRVESKNHSGFDFHIKSHNYFTYYSTQEYYFLGLYYGILLIMAVYNILVYFSVREKVYLYYVLYVLCGILTTLTDDGLGYQFVWSGFPTWNSIIGVEIAPSLLLLSFVLYSVNFLDLNLKYPKLKKIIYQVTAGYFVFYLLKLTVLPSVFHLKIFYLIPFLTVFSIAIYCFRHGYRPARYFIAGYTFILISLVIIQLRSNGSIEGNLFTVYSFNYGLVLEVVIFSFALAERIKYIKKEKEEAQKVIIQQLEENKLLQEKVNRELEAKVSERTEELKRKNSELEITNQKLLEMTEKANQMSLKLDVDNWNLQKNIKEAIQARMNDEEVTYEEFKKIFPDELSCYRYLNDLKWGKNEFKCRKCGNSKYIEGTKQFSRKCTRCGYPESVTAYTLFHGLRFPIDKAFYLTYLIHKKENAITLDELSELLDLRRNTCWSFKKKVMESLTNYKKGKKKIVESWEDVILD